MITRTGCLVLVLSASACADRPATQSSVVRDSSGITIVDNPSPVWTDSAETWRVEETPLVEIGVVEGATEYQFSGVRRALRLPNGGVLVADGASSELRFYDVNGKHLRSTGGSGEGPGEFRVISLLERYGADSLAVYDFGLERVSIMDLEGTFVRSFRRPAVGSFVYVHGFFDDGSLMASADEGVNLDTMAAGILRANNIMFRLSADGSIDTIGRFFSGESYVTRAERSSISSMPFARQAVRVVDGDRFHYGTSETYEIDTYTRNGSLTRKVRVARPNTPLTQRDIDNYIETSASRINDQRARSTFVSRTRELPPASTLPAYRALMVDTERNLWVAEYQLDAESRKRWTVFDNEGHLLGSIELPAGLTLMDIGPDFVLGVVRDEMNVEQVVLHRLVKPKT